MEIEKLVSELRRRFPGFKNASNSEIIEFSLKQQLPKEATLDELGWKCPSCGIHRKERFSHCPACGQFLSRKEDDKQQEE